MEMTDVIQEHGGEIAEIEETEEIEVTMEMIDDTNEENNIEMRKGMKGATDETRDPTEALSKTLLAETLALQSGIRMTLVLPQTRCVEIVYPTSLKMDPLRRSDSEKTVPTRILHHPKRPNLASECGDELLKSCNCSSRS
jgi:hypothetical protein